MSEYIISDEQRTSERWQAYEAGRRNRDEPIEFVVMLANGDASDDIELLLNMCGVENAGGVIGEPIVRCKDCEFAAYKGEECMRVDEWDDSLWFPVEPDGFCKWGERREP